MTDHTAQHIKLPARRVLRAAGWANISIAAVQGIGLCGACSQRSAS